MDLEQIKKVIPELIALLAPELKGTQKFVFDTLLENINKIVGYQELQIRGLTAGMDQLKAEIASKAEPVAEVVN